MRHLATVIAGLRASRRRAPGGAGAGVILGLGSDICDIRRIERAMERFGERFLPRVFTETERSQAERRHGHSRAAAPTPSASPPRRRAPRRSAPASRAACSCPISAWSTCRAASRRCVWPAGAAVRLAALLPAGHAARIDLTMTDEYPYAYAQVIISAEPAALP